MADDVENSDGSGSALRRLDEGPSPPPSAPWCVNTWGPDLHGSDRRKFPVELAGGDFAKALGIPLQLYAPYFCPESKYFSRIDPSSNWTSVISNNSIPGCGNYGFQDITPEESLEFYRWLFAKGQDAGMISFEPDFILSQDKPRLHYYDEVNSQLMIHELTSQTTTRIGLRNSEILPKDFTSI